MKEIEKLRAEARTAPLLGHRLRRLASLGGYVATFSRDMTDGEFELLAMTLADIGFRLEDALAKA